MQEPQFTFTKDENGVFCISIKIWKDVIMTDGKSFDELYANIQDAVRLYQQDKQKVDWEYYLLKYFYKLSLLWNAFDLQAGKQYA